MFAPDPLIIIIQFAAERFSARAKAGREDDI
jgi:hypothetical protein